LVLSEVYVVFGAFLAEEFLLQGETTL